MPVNPADIRWAVCGVSGQDPRGTPVPLTPELRTVLAGLVTVPTPEPDPGPDPTPGELPPVPPGAKRHQIEPSDGIPNLAARDQLLFRRGSVYPRRQLNLNAPCYVGAFGQGKAPVLNSHTHGIVVNADGVTIDGLHLLGKGDRQASTAGLFINRPVSNLRVTRVLARLFGNGITYPHQKAGNVSRNHRYEQCVFADNDGSGYTGQGVYGSFAVDVTFEKCAFVGNGWKSPNGTRRILEHGSYVQGSRIRDGKDQPIYDTGARNWRFIDCTYIDNAGFGPQVRVDGGAIRGSAILRQPLGALLNGPEHTAFVGNAVVVSGAAQMYDPAKHGGGGLDWHSQKGTIAGNVMALPPGAMNGVNIPHPCFNIGPRAKDPFQGWPWDQDVSAEGADNHAFGWADAKVIQRGKRTDIDLLKVERHGGCPSLDESWIDTLASRLRAGDFSACDAVPHVSKVRQWLGLA